MRNFNQIAIGCWYFFEIHFCHESPVVQDMWCGNCFFVTWNLEEFQPSCKRKCRGPHGKTFWDYFSLANCELVFHVSFSHHYRYRWHWVIGFRFILIFLITPYFSPFSSSRLIFSYVPPLSHQPPPPSSPRPSYMYPVHSSSPRSSADWISRHWTVNLTPD